MINLLLLFQWKISNSFMMELNHLRFHRKTMKTLISKTFIREKSTKELEKFIFESNLKRQNSNEIRQIPNEIVRTPNDALRIKMTWNVDFEPTDYTEFIRKDISCNRIYSVWLFVILIWFFILIAPLDSRTELILF